MSFNHYFQKEMKDFVSEYKDGYKIKYEVQYEHKGVYCEMKHLPFSLLSNYCQNADRSKRKC